MQEGNVIDPSQTARRKRQKKVDPRSLRPKGYYLKADTGESNVSFPFISWREAALAFLILFLCVAVSYFLWVRPPELQLLKRVREEAAKRSPVIPAQLAKERPAYNSEYFEEISDDDIDKMNPSGVEKINSEQVEQNVDSAAPAE